MKLSQIVDAVQLVVDFVVFLESRKAPAEPEIRDVTPTSPPSPHSKDYTQGKGLFGKHKGVYDWGK